jgi:hypothetical protein
VFFKDQLVVKEKHMKKSVGLWIDHRKAVIVTIENEMEQTYEILSNMEKHVRFASDMAARNSGEVHGSTAEDVRDRQFGDHLDTFYDEVIAFIRGADSIWIFGPGEAKGELENRLKRDNLDKHIISVETVDKMTDRQIAARVLNEPLPK